MSVLLQRLLGEHPLRQQLKAALVPRKIVASCKHRPISQAAEQQELLAPSD
jgi:hypothetical protein